MKKFILFVFLFTNIVSLKADNVWSPVARLTSGYKDDNPSLSTYSAFQFMLTRDYCVFERTSGAVTQICAVRFNPASPDTSVSYLTSNNNPKKNPVVSQNTYPYGVSNDNINSLAVWQEFRNGKWDLMGSVIKNVTSWSAPFVIDSSAGDKNSPVAIVISSNNFKVAYAKNNDIYFLSFNPVSLAANTIQVTHSAGEIYSAPAIGNISTSDYVVIYSSSSGSLYSNNINAATLAVSAPVTVESGTGNWKVSNARQSFPGPTYFYCKEGMIKYNVNSSSPSPQIFASDPNKKYACPQSYIFPIITDNAPDYHFISFIQTSNDTTKLIMMSKGPTSKDTVYIGDSTSSKHTAMSYAMQYVNMEKVYFVFAKDSADQRNLYYVSGWIESTDIHDGSQNIAIRYSLYQNYPNPFNPATNIDFSIPKASSISLVVYDIAGKEVERIYNNEAFNTGSYHAVFNGNNFSSGIYFYSLIADGITMETRRMVLLK